MHKENNIKFENIEEYKKSAHYVKLSSTKKKVHNPTQLASDLKERSFRPNPTILMRLRILRRLLAS
jgi:hypothetical protein